MIADKIARVKCNLFSLQVWKNAAAEMELLPSDVFHRCLRVDSL